MLLISWLACAEAPPREGGQVEVRLDADGDGWWAQEGDCDDSDPAVNPGELESPYNGLDDDCDPGTPDDDLDGDGWGIAEDCDDQDEGIFPGAEDPEDGVDQDCDGVDSCGRLVAYTPQLTLHDENLGFFCDSPYNATADQKLKVQLDGDKDQGLLCLCRAGGVLSVDGPALRRLEGLQHLGWAGELELNRVGVRDLRGLEGLRTGELRLLGLFSLESLEGLGTRELSGALELLSYSEVLRDLRGLQLERVGSLVISSNPALRSLDGLESLERVEGDLELSYNPELVDLEALHGLWVGGDVELSWNERLSAEAIAAFLESAEIAGAIHVQGNAPEEEP